MEVCSLSSAWSVTRPCCFSTRLKCFVWSKVSLVKSPLIGRLPRLIRLAREQSCSDASGREQHTHVEASRGVFLQPRAQVDFPLRLKEVVERAHLRLVVGAAQDFLGAGARQLGIPRIAVP